MSFNNNILFPSGIIFSALCTVLIVHLFSEPTRSDITKTIFVFSLVYGDLFSATEIYQSRNSPNYGISVSGTIGAVIGLVAWFYLGYRVCILARVIDAETLLGSSSGNRSALTFAISGGCAEMGRQLGSFFGNVLFPT